MIGAHRLAASGQPEEALALFDQLNQHPLAEQWQAQHPDWPSLPDAPLQALQPTSLRRNPQAA